MQDKIELIASDVDGTLLFDYAPALPPATLEIVERLLDRGIVFVPASGRAYDSLCNLFGTLVDRMPVIANNGTIAYYAGQVVFRSGMDRTLGDELIDAILATGDCEVLVTGALTSYTQPKSPSFPDFMRNTVGFDVTVVDDLKAIDEPYTKISAYYPSRAVDEAFWVERFGSRCSIATAGFGWIDMMPTGTCKARALTAVIELLGIAPRNIVAFGDARNDLEMLQMAGLSYAMQAGDPRAIEAADRTTADAAGELRRILKSISLDEEAALRPQARPGR